MRFEDCPKCKMLTLYGTEAGVSRRLSALVIPLAAAKHLANWGSFIYSVRMYGPKIVSELWSPAYGESEDSWLVLEHHCSQDRHNWQFHPPTYGPTKKRRKPAPSPNVRGFED